MIKLKSTIAFILVLFIQSCTNNNKPCHASYEMIGTRDTVNFTDCDGLKQGKWVPSVMNKLKDTLYYRNDTLLN